LETYGTTATLLLVPCFQTSVIVLAILWTPSNQK